VEEDEEQEEQEKEEEEEKEEREEEDEEEEEEGRRGRRRMLVPGHHPAWISFSLFSRSLASNFLVGVKVRLNLPAVTVLNWMPSLVSRSYTLGIANQGQDAVLNVWFQESFK